MLPTVNIPIARNSHRDVLRQVIAAAGARTANGTEINISDPNAKENVVGIRVLT